MYHYNDEDFNSAWYSQYILESKEDLLKNLCGNCWNQVEFEREMKLYENKGHKTLQIIK